MSIFSHCHSIALSVNSMTNLHTYCVGFIYGRWLKKKLKKTAVKIWEM